MGNNSDDLMFEYLLQMGAMQPEQQDMKRKQEMVAALRQGAMQAPQGQMIGKHYVAPSLTQYGAQLGQGLLAGMQQQNVDKQFQGMNDRQRQMLEELRRRRGMSYTPPSTASLMPDDRAVGGGFMP